MDQKESGTKSSHLLWWWISGTRRKVGAIDLPEEFTFLGSYESRRHLNNLRYHPPEKFTVSGRAWSKADAEEGLRHYLCLGGYEQIHIEKFEVLLEAGEIYERYNWKAFCDLRNLPDHPPSDYYEDFVLTMDEAKAIGVIIDSSDDLSNVIVDSITSD
jgi:hypothetical protein